MELYHNISSLFETRGMQVFGYLGSTPLSGIDRYRSGTSPGVPSIVKIGLVNSKRSVEDME